MRKEPENPCEAVLIHISSKFFFVGAVLLDTGQPNQAPPEHVVNGCVQIGRGRRCNSSSIYLIFSTPVIPEVLV